jgi:hypothetical protein
MLRRLLILAVCACLGLQGVGPAFAAESPCPFEADMVAAMLSGELDGTDLPDCCNDLQTWSETGHLCDQGLDCAGLGVWAPAPSPREAATASGSDPVVRPALSSPSAPPDTPWRPPAAA